MDRPIGPPVDKPNDPVVALCVTPKSFDDLLDNLDFDFAQLQEKLLNLQLEGALSQDFMGRWCTRP